MPTKTPYRRNLEDVMPQPHQEKFNAFLTPASLAQETGLGLGA